MYRNITFSRSCEWTINLHPHKFCEKPTLNRKSYCKEHYQKAYVVLKDEDIDKIVEKDLDLFPSDDILDIWEEK